MKTCTLLFVFCVLLGLALGTWLTEPGYTREARAAFFSRPVSLAPAATPSARYGHSMVTISNTVYLFGGAGTATGNSGTELSPIAPLSGPVMDDLWEFNKDNSEFVKVTPANSPPSARHSYAATTYNGKLYIFGGVGANGSVLNDAWSYDPATRAWTQLSQQGQLPEARYQHTAVSIGDFIYIFGGFTQGGGLTLDYAYRFDPLTGTWLERGSAFASRAGHSAVVYNDKMYIWGGQTYGNVLFNSMRMYDPQTNSWPTVSQLSGTLPVSRTLQSTASADDKIYIFQGRSAGNPEFGDAFMCSLFDYLCVQMAAVYGAQQGAAAAYQDGTGGSQASAAAVTRTRILLFGGLRDGQALSTQLIYDPLFSQRLYLPVMMRNPP